MSALGRMRSSLARASAGVDDDVDNVAGGRPGLIEVVEDLAVGGLLFGALFGALWLPSWLGGLP